MHLSSLVRDKYSSNVGATDLVPIENHPVELDKYELLAQEIDEGGQILRVEGIIELVEQTTDSMVRLPIVCSNIEGVIKFIGAKFNDKTKQLNAISHIKDNRLRLRKATKIANSLSIDLNSYSNDLNEMLPDFEKYLNIAIESYTKLILTASESSHFVQEVEKQMKTVVPELYNAIDDALVGIAGFLNAMGDLPTITSKFGKSKRKAELSTNELFKEFISAKKIMKQLMDGNWR